MRCALYARVSSGDQNCEMQLRELRDYVFRQGWKITEQYVDSGFSGRKKNRPALDRMMADAAKRKFQCVLCYKLDRLGRSVLHLSQTLATLDSHGIRFIATSQGLDTDAANPTSTLLLNILASVAAFEVELIKERTISGIKAARAKGKRLGRPMKIFHRDQVMKLRDDWGMAECSGHDSVQRLPDVAYKKCGGNRLCNHRQSWEFRRRRLAGFDHKTNEGIWDDLWKSKNPGDHFGER
jgi:DNA invertase Pin-like site-specific DNA recombinase